MKKENNRIGKTPKCNLDFMIGIAIMIVAIILFIMNELNAVQYQLLTYDESYNATVAANVARYGEYRVSYPSKSVFYNMITTGETMLLPTALVYKLFGINTITSSIIPLVYMQYKTLADAETNVIFGGRLGEYKYYDMDAVVKAALVRVFRELC